MLTRRIFKNCLVALMCLTFVAAGCGDDNDDNNGGGGQLTDAGGDGGATDGGSNNDNPDSDGGTEDGGSEEDADPNYDPCNDPNDPDAYCPCEEGESYCNGECVNVNGSSADHCGACNATCFDWSGSCEQGTCICNDPNASYCDGYCILTSEDRVNCGRCGNVCGADNVCFDSDCMSLGERVAYEVNQYRNSEMMCSGSPIGPNAPLRFDPLLTAPAQEHAEDMAANEGEAEGDLGARIQDGGFEGNVTLPLQASGFTADSLVNGDNGLLSNYCSEVLDPDATAIGVGVAGEVGSLHWVVVVGNDG